MGSERYQRRPERANDRPAVANRRGRIAIALALFLGTALLYARAVGFGFIPLDDPFYVTENPWVTAGPTGRGLTFALTSYQSANWHPLTWLSLMTDSALGDGLPWAFHLTNVLCHALSASILFVACDGMTGRRAASAIVAALFACHPLHVESVAWVSERKEVLAALFGFLAIFAYSGWARRPTRSRYLAVVGCHALSLAAKPTWVTLPILLLLLDVWPLARVASGASVSLRARVLARIREKLPLFALSLAAGAVAIVAQRSASALGSFETWPPYVRLANALFSSVVYLGKIFWPSDLAVFYPLPASGLPWPALLLAGGALAVISALALGPGRRLNYFPVGWFWYLVAVAPVIGVVQVGLQARADRYTYVPSVGIFLLLAFGLSDLVDSIPVAAAARRFIRRLVATAAITACCAVTWTQLGYWKNGVALFRHTIAVTGPNAVARNCLGRALLEEGRTEEASAQFREAVAIASDFADARANLAGTLVHLGRVDEGVAEYRAVLLANPRHVLANANLGRILLARQDYEGAARCLTASIAGRPAHAETRAALGAALLRLGRPVEAATHLSEALRIDPTLTDARVDLGIALAQSGDVSGATRELALVLRRDPSNSFVRELLTTLQGGATP